MPGRIDDVERATREGDRGHEGTHVQALRRRPAHRLPRDAQTERGAADRGRREHVRRRTGCPGSRRSTFATPMASLSYRCAGRSSTPSEPSTPAATWSSPRAPKPVATPGRSPRSPSCRSSSTPSATRFRWSPPVGSSTVADWPPRSPLVRSVSGSGLDSSPHPKHAPCPVTERRCSRPARTARSCHAPSVERRCVYCETRRPIATRPTRRC